MNHTLTISQHSTIHTNQQIIDERVQQLNNIAKDVEAINEIYKDIALLIEDQGFQINTISDNIEQSACLTEQALQEVKKAQKRQNKTCVIF